MVLPYLETWFYTKDSSSEMVRLILLLLLGYSAWLVHGQASVCQSISGQPGCVCQHPDGVIDLTSIANSGGSPSFTGLEDPNDYSYDFNPCYKYSDVQCTNVYICQIPNFDPTSSYDIADGNEQIMIDPSDSRGHVYLQYSGPGDNGGSPRSTKVYLHCDQSKTSPTASTEGDSHELLHYIISFFYHHSGIFDLYSCAACPGGCEGGDVSGPIGLAIIFVTIAAVLAYFIVGAVIMRVKYQATGTDIIPNKNFWFNIPFLIKDGCVFTFGPCADYIRGKRGYSKM